jgi:hypothetical protein
MTLLLLLASSYFWKKWFSEESALRSIFEIKCDRQNDRSGHVIILWFGSESEFDMVTTSQTHISEGVNQFVVFFVMEIFVFEQTKPILISWKDHQLALV